MARSLSSASSGGPIWTAARRWIPLIVLAALLSDFAARPAEAQVQLADSVTLTTISDGNPGTNDNGWANVEINATAFKNQSVVTVGNYQFTSYYAADQQLILGRRNLVTSPDTWTLLRTGFTSANINDSHNVSTIAIDGDGYLHTSWGIHNNPIRYARSTAPVLNDSPIAMSGMLTGVIPEQDGSITYPEFWNIPGSGDLLFSYRTGGSGNGEYQLSRWNNATDAWLPVHVRVGSTQSQSGDQPWIDNDFENGGLPNVNAYHNGLVYDSTGRLHVTWTWRTGGDSPTPFGDYQSNHNFMYAYSDNDGVDWRLADGTLLQRTDTGNNLKHDVDEDNATPAILIPEGSSLINQASSAVGPDDTLYVATWWAPDAAQGSHTRQYMLAAYNPYQPQPQWQTYQVSNRHTENSDNRVAESQLGAFRMSRPIVLTDEDNRVFVVYSDYQRGQGVTVSYSESPIRDDWQTIDLATNENLRLWEPKYDVNRWQNDGVLSMLYQPAGGGLAPTPVSILEWDALAFFLNLAGPPLRLQVNRTTGAVTIANPDDEVVELSAYTISSASGQLAPARWSSFQQQALSGWSETQALATALAEANGSGTLSLAASGGSAAIGNPFVGQPLAFGVDAPADLTFQYMFDGVERTGTVTYSGVSLNNLTLLVDPATGLARLENTSPFSVSIDGYTIASASASLDPVHWTSLDDQGAAGGQWEEANVGPGRVSELQAAGDTLLAGGDAFEMGRLFDAAGGQQDLVFQFIIAGQSTSMTGVVLYTSVGLPGDYNASGIVDAADYTVWRNTLGDTVASGTGADGNRDGVINAADYDFWKARFGNTVPGGFGSGPLAAAVPEPSAAMLAGGLALVGLVIRRPPRRPSRRAVSLAGSS